MQCSGSGLHTAEAGRVGLPPMVDYFTAPRLPCSCLLRDFHAGQCSVSPTVHPPGGFSWPGLEHIISCIKHSDRRNDPPGLAAAALPRTALTELACTQASGETIRGAGYSLAGHLPQMSLTEAEPPLWPVENTLAVHVGCACTNHILSFPS